MTRTILIPARYLDGHAARVALSNVTMKSKELDGWQNFILKKPKNYLAFGKSKTFDEKQMIDSMKVSHAQWVINK